MVFIVSESDIKSKAHYPHRRVTVEALRVGITVHNINRKDVRDVEIEFYVLYPGLPENRIAECVPKLEISEFKEISVSRPEG